MKNRILVEQYPDKGFVWVKLQIAQVTAVNPGIKEQKMDIYADGIHITLSKKALQELLKSVDLCHYLKSEVY